MKLLSEDEIIEARVKRSLLPDWPTKDAMPGEAIPNKVILEVMRLEDEAVISETERLRS